MTTYYGKQVIKSYIYPILDEFGYVLPDGDLQRKMDERFDECDKPCSVTVFLDDNEAIKTASARAEWKPLEATNNLDRTEGKALRRMSRKRARPDYAPCHICLGQCDRPTTIECEHTFCYSCIKKWMGIKRQCPVCDTEINVSKYVRKKRLKIPCKKT